MNNDSTEITAIMDKLQKIINHKNKRELARLLKRLFPSWFGLRRLLYPRWCPTSKRHNKLVYLIFLLQIRGLRTRLFVCEKAMHALVFTENLPATFPRSSPPSPPSSDSVLHCSVLNFPYSYNNESGRQPHRRIIFFAMATAKLIL
jgi:hypothetical protein